MRRSFQFRTARLLRRIRSFAADRRGHISFLTAILSLPLLGVGGMAVDHISAASTVTRISTAADAAALAAVNTAKNVAMGKASPSGTNDPLAAGKIAGEAVFAANMKNIGAAQLDAAFVDVRRSDSDFMASVAWQAQASSAFGKIFGVTSRPLEGHAEARSGAPLFHDIHIVMDMSASMLIGATRADIQRTFELTNCAFACHINENTLATVRAAGGVRMRIDVMKDAIIAAIEELRRRADMPNQHRFAVYTFASRVETLIDINAPLARNYDEVIRIVRSAEPTRTNGAGTHLPTVLAFMEGQFRVGSSGTIDQPMQSMILISDGVQDRRFAPLSGWGVDHDFALPMPHPEFGHVSAMDPGRCDAIKAKSVNISMVHMEYLIPPRFGFSHDESTDSLFNFIADSLLPNMHRTMGGCASSPDNYVEASTPEQIYAAINTVLATFVRPRITQ